MFTTQPISAVRTCFPKAASEGDGVRVDYEDASGYRGWADEMFRPGSEAEVVEILGRACAAQIPVTIIGSLTGITGGAAARGGWAISMERLVNVEIREGSAICGPGLRLCDLQAAAQ